MDYRFNVRQSLRAAAGIELASKFIKPDAGVQDNSHKYSRKAQGPDQNNGRGSPQHKKQQR